MNNLLRVFSFCFEDKEQNYYFLGCCCFFFGVNLQVTIFLWLLTWWMKSKNLITWASWELNTRKFFSSRKQQACMLQDRQRWELIAKCFCTRFVVVYESLFHDQNVSLWSFSIFIGKLIQFLLNGVLIHSATTNVMLIFHEFPQSYKKFKHRCYTILRCTFHL